MNNKDKIIVFCDEIDSLKSVFDTVESVYDKKCIGPISMEANESQRVSMIHNFKNCHDGAIIFSPEWETPQ